MRIPQPYLLFLGDVDDPLAVKMARGVSTWRPDACVGQLRLSEHTPSVGVPDMSIAEAVDRGAKSLVIGVANFGGRLPTHWLETAHEAIRQRMNIVNGMHFRLSLNPQTARLAEDYGVQLLDLRYDQPPLDVGSGEPRSGNRLLTVGTDCTVGKMHTALALEAQMRSQGMDVAFRATGQSGILIAGDGIAVDAVIADFIAGAVELLSPASGAHHWDIIEGQGSLFHPAYAGVSLGLLHGAQPSHMVMCHELERPHMRHLPGRPLPDLEDCIDANLKAATVTSPDTKLIGFSINTSRVSEKQAQHYLRDLESHYDVPASDPVRFGIEPLVTYLQEAEK